MALRTVTVEEIKKYIPDTGTHFLIEYQNIIHSIVYHRRLGDVGGTHWLPDKLQMYTLNSNEYEILKLNPLIYDACDGVIIQRLEYSGYASQKYVWGAPDLESLINGLL